MKNHLHIDIIILHFPLVRNSQREEKKHQNKHTHTQRLRQQADNGVNILLCSSSMKAILLIFNGFFLNYPEMEMSLTHTVRLISNTTSKAKRTKQNWSIWKSVKGYHLSLLFVVADIECNIGVPLHRVRSFFSQSKLKPSNECVQCERVQARKSVVRLVVAVAFLCFLVLFGCQRQVCPARIVQLNSKLHFDRWS